MVRNDLATLGFEKQKIRHLAFEKVLSERQKIT